MALVNLVRMVLSFWEKMWSGKILYLEMMRLECVDVLKSILLVGFSSRMSWFGLVWFFSMSLVTKASACGPAPMTSKG